MNKQDDLQLRHFFFTLETMFNNSENPLFNVKGDNVLEKSSYCIRTKATQETRILHMHPLNESETYRMLHYF
jgi:hypothetical protein